MAGVVHLAAVAQRALQHRDCEAGGHASAAAACSKGRPSLLLRAADRLLPAAASQAAANLLAPMLVQRLCHPGQAHSLPAALAVLVAGLALSSLPLLQVGGRWVGA